MNESGENEVLLGSENTAVSYRGDGSSTGEDSGSRSEEWSDGTGSATDSSCESSYCSGSDSYAGSEAEWEAEVNQNGELFYIKSSPVLQVDQPVVDPKPSPEVESLTRRNRHSTRGKLVHLIRRRNSKRQLTRNSEISSRTQPAANQPDGVASRATSSNKVTFHDWQEGEVREVTMSVDPRGRHNLGRRATLCETLLGLVVSTFADETRIMVAGFIPNGEAIRYKSIKIGDWLRCIDEQEVTFQTIDAFLGNITAPCKVHLKLQRVAGCEVTEQVPPPGSLSLGSRRSELVKQLLGLASSDTPPLGDVPVGVVYLSMEEGGEVSQEDQGVVYCYPPLAADNLLAQSRGCFLTLQHLLPDAAHSTPVSSTVLLRDQLFHVIYTAQGQELMLLAVPDSRCPLREAVEVCADVVRFLEFRYQSLSRAFHLRERQEELDAYFCLFFRRLLCSQEPRHLALWEELLPAAHWVPLPKEAQIQLDECLSELESNDFGALADGPNDYQRMYVIIGTCMYHKGYLLGSHLARGDLVDAHSLCRQQGLLLLCRSEPVNSLVVWREVFPSSCGRGLQQTAVPISPYQPPLGRWFLLLVGQGQDLLGVLLESGGCTVRAVDHPGPDTFYVEQAQEMLAYLQDIGIPTVADKWLAVNPRPCVSSPESVVVGKSSHRRAEQLLGFVKPAESSASAKSSPVAGSSGSPVSRKPPEVTSILKRRGSLDRSFACSMSGISLQGSTSEDSASQAASVVSEISDEAAPILGRRAEREKDNVIPRLASNSQSSDDSDSDWEMYRNESREKDCAFDLSDVRKSLLTQVEDIVPAKLTAGEPNVLFHYVRLDLTEGVLLCPPDHTPSSGVLNEVLHNFRRSCQIIHALLQNTVRFKKLLVQDIAKSNINKSLIAIKEHGTLFECTACDSEAAGKRPALPLTYWVIGRLFFTPYPREVYVCYHDAAPQNMVEIAFRLGLCTSG